MQYFIKLKALFVTKSFEICFIISVGIFVNQFFF
jgi:hypothetical protein